MTNQMSGFMPARIQMPYTLTAGPAMGTFLAALGERRILGSRCGECKRTRVPAQDFCPECGADAWEFVTIAETGELVGFTETAQGTIALIRLDGADTPLLHRIVDADASSLQLGQRVRAVWSDAPEGGMLDLAGFAPHASAPEGSATRPDSVPEPIAQLAYTMTLDYEHAYGHYYGTLFDGIASARRLRGVRCSSCRSVLMPPRATCERCLAPTQEWVDIPDTGVVQGCSIVHIEFQGQRVPPPYVYAEIVLDGTATRLIHTVAGLSPEDARAGGVRPGSRVQAVWSDRTTGSLTDIDYFRVIES